MKEIFEALNTRIKSPVFGYFIISWLAFNWKPMFLMLFSDGKATEKVALFESQTGLSSLLLGPFLIGVSVAAIYPWANYYFLKICQKPTDLRNSLQAESEHRLLLRKQEFESTRATYLANREESLIDQAKRDQEILSIGDEEIREKLQAQIDQLRMELSQKDQLSESKKRENEELLERLKTMTQDIDEKGSHGKLQGMDASRLVDQLQKAGMHEVAADLLHKMANKVTRS